MPDGLVMTTTITMLEKKTGGIRWIQLIEDLLEKFTDLYKVAENKTAWRTLRRDFHKSASRADNRMKGNKWLW